ncbi:MAG: hypothetical protein KTR25_14620 [Myxococcales bacterium]|nr:hypothetical protein [Myxococcales bacterium]
MAKNRSILSQRRAKKRRAAVRWILISISIVLFCVLIFPNFRRPRRASAEPVPTWLRALRAVEPIPTFLHRVSDVSEPRRAYFGDQELFYRVQTVDQSPDHVLNFYLDKYRGATTHFLDKVVSESIQGTDALSQDHLDTLEKGLIVRGDGQRFLGVLDPVDRQATKKQLLNRLAKFHQTGKLGELWVGRIIHIFPVDEFGSRVVSIWTSADFNIKTLHKALTNPSFIDPKLPRPKNAELVLNFRLPDEDQPGALTVVHAPMSHKQAGVVFTRDLENMGWSQTPSLVKSTFLRSFSNEQNQEIQLAIREDPDSPAYSFISMLQWDQKD